jgi:hypothetical protein
MPGDRAVQYLAERLGRLEAMPVRQRRSPRADLIRAQLDDAAISESACRLR